MLVDQHDVDRVSLTLSRWFRSKKPLSWWVTSKKPCSGESGLFGMLVDQHDVDRVSLTLSRWVKSKKPCPGESHQRNLVQVSHIKETPVQVSHIKETLSRWVTHKNPVQVSHIKKTTSRWVKTRILYPGKWNQKPLSRSVHVSKIKETIQSEKYSMEERLLWSQPNFWKMSFSCQVTRSRNQFICQVIDLQY